jgi:hypothetical protein
MIIITTFIRAMFFWGDIRFQGFSGRPSNNGAFYEIHLSDDLSDDDFSVDVATKKANYFVDGSGDGYKRRP